MWFCSAVVRVEPDPWTKSLGLIDLKNHQIVPCAFVTIQGIQINYGQLRLPKSSLAASLALAAACLQ